jgi:hypothetical protein
MNLLQRYRKLNPWNKLAVWGSICSVLGLLYLFIPSKPSKANIHIEHSLGALIQNAINSPNPVQIGSVTINQNKQQYRPVSSEIRQSVEDKMANFRKKYAETPPVVNVEYESGNNERFKVGATLGEMLIKQSLGRFDATSTSIGRFPGYAITLHCGKNGSEMASDFLSSISPYLKGDVNIVIIPQWPANQMRLYLNGTPSFSENGSVIIE